MRHTKRHRRWLLGALLTGACCALLACGSEPRLASWNRIDIDAVRETLEDPTGEIHAGELEEFLQDVERRIPYLIDVADELAHVLAAVDDLEDEEGSATVGSYKSDGETASTTTSATGTTVYLAIACPGSGEQAARDFSHGELRVESPGFTSSDELKSLLDGGDLLVSFESCELPAVRLTGSVPALFRTDLSAMAVDFRAVSLALTGEALDVEGAPDIVDENGNAQGNLGLPVLGVIITLDTSWREAVRIEAIIGTERYHFTLDMTLGEFETTVLIHAFDGSIGCSYQRYSDPRFTCDVQ